MVLALEGAKGVWEGAVDGLFDLLIYFCMDFANTSNWFMDFFEATSNLITSN